MKRRMTMAVIVALLAVTLPNPAVRSLNLSTSVGIALYEALRQTGSLKR